MNDWELRWIEWKLREAEYRTSRLQTRYTALEQNLMWMQPPNNRCSTTISGKIIGGYFGLNTALPGSTIKVVGHNTSEDYGTYTATDGTYSIELQLDPSDTSLDLHVTGPGSRFATGVTQKSIAQCFSNSITNILATPATGYTYWGYGSSGGGWCNYPIRTAMNFDDTAGGNFWGTGTLNWSAGFWGPNPYTKTSRTGVTCPSATVHTSIYLYDSGGSPGVGMLYRINSAVSTTCPSMPGNVDQGMVGGAWPSITYSYAITCPDGGSTGFTMTFSWVVPGSLANHPWFAPGSYSITFTEAP